MKNSARSSSLLATRPLAPALALRSIVEHAGRRWRIFGRSYTGAAELMTYELRALPPCAGMQPCHLCSVPGDELTLIESPEVLPSSSGRERPADPLGVCAGGDAGRCFSEEAS